MKSFFITVVTAIATVSCATTPAAPPVSRIPFPEAEYASVPTAEATGSATISGQAFLKTRGGDVKTAAGNEVLLNPVTSYSEQWFEINYVKQQTIEKHDPRLERYARRTTADAEGRFTFRNIPPGEYFVVTTIVWEAPVGYGGALVPQGGTVAKRVTVSDGQHLDIIVTR